MEAKTAVRKTRGNPAWRASLTLTFAAALTSTWTGVHIAGIKLTDYLLVAGMVFVLLAAVSNGCRLPIYAWAVLPPVALLLIALIGSVVRGDPLSSRQVVTTWIVGNAPVFNEYGGALPLIARMALSLTAVTIIVAGVSDNMQGGNVLVERIMCTWAAGAAISGAYGVIAHIGKISALANLPFLTHLSDTRASGLANHPNSLGQTIVTALPVLIYMVGATRGLAKVVMALSLPISMYAIFLSGSRAALFFGTVFAVVTFAYLVSSGKRIPIWVLPVTTFLVPLAIVAMPTVLKGTRFFDKAGQMSDAGRMANLERGIDLFNANPLFGAGVGSWTDEMVPLILLTSGGVLYFVVFYGSLAYPLLVRPRSSGGVFVPILVISAVSVFCFGLLANGIVERYLYWPFAALFAFSLGHYPQTNTAAGAVSDAKTVH